MTSKIAVFGQHDEATLAQLHRAASHEAVVAAALCADGHLGYGVPIGAVIAYREAVSPSGVGYDISCGNKAVLTDMPGTEARANIRTIMDDIWAHISFGMGRKNAERVDHPLFDDPAWQIPAVARLRDKAAAQLGTVGSGNHYVDVMTDERDRVWIGVHFGSRGLGHGIATHYLRAGGAGDGMDSEPLVVPARGELGSEYLVAMALAGRYAYAGRDWVCAKVAKLLGAVVLDEVHQHHNFAWQEWHQGIGEVWVVRKGATPAFPGQRGFVGGSMGDISVILEGADDDVMSLSQLAGQLDSLHSTVHGAGRVLSRTKAAGKARRRWIPDPAVQDERRAIERSIKGTARGSTQREEMAARLEIFRGMGSWQETVLKEGVVSREMMREWVEREGVELRGAGVDESPHCYRRLPEVLQAHAGTINILHELRPLGVAMAGEGDTDPYKD